MQRQPPGWSHAAVIFLAAFLLFQVQPLIARIVLPLFGGSSAVWATCLFFFQAVLLLGYLYADVAARRVPPRRLAPAHGALLAATLLALPLSPAAAARHADPAHPVGGILALLALTVGAPYLVLASTSPLVQAWHAAAAGDRPYRLYAWSNTGSLLGLLSYPFLVEPYFPLRTQALAWSALYGLCALAIAALAFANRGAAAPAAHSTPVTTAPAAAPAPPPVRAADLALWTALAATSVTLLVAVTNHLTQNIVPFPFLWIVPLTLYLLSFIVCFAADGRFYQRWLWLALAAPALLGVPYLLTLGPLRVVWLVPAFAAILFVCCMVCHGELHRARPPAARLTLFYLMVALGGALGGLFAGVIAPMVFSGDYELHTGVAACALLVTALLARDAARGAGGAALRRALPAAAGAVTLGLLGWLGYEIREERRAFTIQQRNFYGVLRVQDQERGQAAVARRTLAHGAIIHGIQWLHPFRSGQPTAYFGVNSGVGRVLAGLGPAPAKVGVIGLGVGTLAAYGRPGDVYRFYEINPAVTELARTQFSFLGQSAAQVEVVPGDGRLSLAREPDQGYDVLVLDAFSGDAIPTHLLTREAFGVYFRHLKPGGLIAVNCSNLYLNVHEAVVQVALSLGRPAIVVGNPAEEENLVRAATWVVIADDPERFARPPFSGMFRPERLRAGRTPWSDDYSNLFQIMKIRG
jgi:hypothetical protein